MIKRRLCLGQQRQDVVEASHHVGDVVAGDLVAQLGHAAAPGQALSGLGNLLADGSNLVVHGGLQFSRNYGNPTEQMVKGLLERSKYKILRYFDDPATGDRYFWDAYDAGHAGIAGDLVAQLDPSAKRRWRLPHADELARMSCVS